MNRLPKISVILPVYNGMKYLAQSVNSVLNQDITDFEFIICDDSSTDESYNFLKNIESEKIKLFRNDRNKGLFPTLNFLIQNAQAPLIHLWAQDDVMQPDCLRETLAYHSQFPEVNFSFSRLQGIDSEGNLLKLPQTFPHKTLSPEGHALSSILYGSISGNIANVCIVKKAAEKVGLFDENMVYVGDFKMWCKLSKNTPIGMNGKVLVHVRQHPEQLSRNLDASYRKLTESKEVFDCFLHTLAPKIRQTARKALKWKIFTAFVTQYFYILRQKRSDLAQKYRKELQRYGFFPALLFRWTVIRILRKIKKEQAFYYRLFYKKIENLRTNKSE